MEYKTIAIIACIAAGIFSTTTQASTCTINVTSNKQTIDGFGFSSAWCGTLSSAKNNALYGTLGMSLLRVRIDEDGGDWTSEKANATAAHAAGATVLGTPWSPPTAWTSNGENSGGYLLSAYYSNYAAWLNTAATTLGLDYVSIQNEPDIGDGSTTWTPAQILSFVKDYCSVISVPVVMPESYCFNDDYSDPVISDSTAVNNFTYLGGHIYGGGLSVHQNALDAGKHVWMTEHYVADSQTSMSTCVKIAKEISNCMNDQMSAYFWWWVADGDTSVNLVSTSGTIYKNGYTIGQFAKWVTPGKVRCSSTYNPTTDVYVTAYHGGGVVIVAVNASTSAVSQQFTIQNSTVSSFSVNRTSASENMASTTAATISSGSFTYSLPALSVTTFHQY
jgi:glucuronoarabinoxylan endo-1,4-beta-xylanase